MGGATGAAVRGARVPKDLTQANRLAGFEADPAATNRLVTRLEESERGVSNPTDLWSFSALVHNAKARPDHPCPFPIEMISRIVKACSNPGETVLDPFSGSGQTVLAAIGEERHSIGIELDPTFHALALERVTHHASAS